LEKIGGHSKKAKNSRNNSRVWKQGAGATIELLNLSLALKVRSLEEGRPY